jgi:hypothetical protein
MSQDDGAATSAAAGPFEDQSQIDSPLSSPSRRRRGSRSPVPGTMSRASGRFVKTLVSKGGGAREFTSPRFKHSSRFDPMPILPTDVDPRLVTSQEDMGERASFHATMYNTVRKSPQRYSAAFNSACQRFGNSKGSFMRMVSSPGFLEYENTPRPTPSIQHAMSRPATSLNGADNGLKYVTAFKSTYEWPKNIELPVNGGGIHAMLDRATSPSKYGPVLVYEQSIAKNLEKTARNYSSTFKTRHKDHTIRKKDRQDFRSVEYESAHPTSMERSTASSPMKYSSMTVHSSKERFTIETKATDDIRDWYDIAHSSRPDMAISVERSPIKYSAFNTTTTHPHNVGKETPSLRRPASQPMSDIKDPSDEGLGSTKCIRCTEWNTVPRFFPDGHPMSMVPARVCNNELRETKLSTIAHGLQTSPIRIKTMSSLTSRTSEVDLCYNPRPGSKLYMTRSNTEWYEGSCKALPAGRMPIADRVASTPQTYKSSMNSLSLRSAVLPTLDPRQTAEFERRRQHILASRVEVMREGDTPHISSQMARILNLEPAPKAEQDKSLSAEDQLALQRQSEDLHAWIGGPMEPARVRSVAGGGVKPSETNKYHAKSKDPREHATINKLGVGQEKSMAPSISKSGVGEETSRTPSRN